MTETVEIRDALRIRVENILGKQERHPVLGRFFADWSQGHDLGGVAVGVEQVDDEGEEFRGEAMRRPVEWLLQSVERRRRMMEEERTDPFRHGYEPGIWRETDWRLAELRCEFPGEAILLAVLGGNGGGKSHYCAKRFAQAMVWNERWLCLQYSLDQGNSRKVPQKLVYDYLPPEQKNEETGKRKKTANTKLSYNSVNGFTDDSFGLENGCQAEFGFYGGGDINSLEGLRPDLVWFDEMVPLDWMRAGMRRLITKAEKTRDLVPRLKAALEARAARLAAGDAEGVDEVYAKMLRPMLPQLLAGVCLVSFTPKNGYTQTVAALVNGARTLLEVEAELLPIVRDGLLAGHEMVPRVQMNLRERAVVVYFHIKDNRHGGNWRAQKRDLASRSREERLWRAYGVATRVQGVQFPLFRREAHVRPVEQVPLAGCWYLVVDPCSDGRNWFMQWWKVAPNPVGKPLLFLAREWPQPDDYIVAGDVGNPGEWAVLEDGKVESGKKKSSSKADGERGPAQRCWGLGFRQYAEEIERVELELFRLERKLAGDEDWETAEGRIEVLDGCRIMDSRAANTETQTHGESATLIQVMQDYELYFLSAGRDSGAEAGQTYVKEGVAMINDRLNYDRNAVELTAGGFYKFHGTAPSLFVADCCKNTIFALSNWTGQDGAKGATKDPVDAMRYLVIANPEPLDAETLRRDGGGYGGGSY